MAETDNTTKKAVYGNLEPNMWPHRLILVGAVVVVLLVGGILILRDRLATPKKSATSQSSASSNKIDGIPKDEINTDSHVAKLQYIVTKSEMK